jgi:hypothetical protein
MNRDLNDIDENRLTAIKDLGDNVFHSSQKKFAQIVWLTSSFSVLSLLIASCSATC